MPRRLISVLSAALLLAGCSRHVAGGTVTLTLTRDYGTQQQRELTERTPPGRHTVRELLERAFHVGITGSVYINGTAAAPTALVNGGDRVWLDQHPAASAQPGAVVGSFPEPFLHGVDGRRFPTTLACANDVGVACGRVSAALSAEGVPAATQELGTGSGQDTIGVVVGTWSDLRGELLASLIEHGPSTSGVYARFANGGQTLQLLDSGGRVVRTLGPDAGLIAATRQGSSAPTWIVTGTDPAGVIAAADAFTRARLRDRFALAVAQRSDLQLPQTP